MFFSQLANVFAIQLQFYFHDNWEFREQAPSTFSPANSFLGVPNIYQHLAPHSIRISKISSLKPISPYRSLYYSETLEILRNWYRKPRSKTDDDWPDLCNHFYPSSYFPFLSLVPDFLRLIFSICWRPSLPVCPVHCGLTRLQGPRGRRMEERRRRSRRPKDRSTTLPNSLVSIHKLCET